MPQFMLGCLLCFFTFFSSAQKVEKNVSDLKFDTVKVSGYLIKTKQPYCFFLPSNDSEYQSISSFLDKYYPNIKNWDPKNFKRSNIFMFNPDTAIFSNASGHAEGYDFFPYELQELNELSFKEILPKLTSTNVYKKKKDDKYRTYQIFYLEARWLKFKLKYSCSNVRSPSTIIPDCTKNYFNCYVLYDYSSLIPITYLDDRKMIQCFPRWLGR